MTIFEEQDVFIERMLSDFSKGLIPQAEKFQPYFDWKSGKDSYPRFSIKEARQMQSIASDLLETFYDKHRGDDHTIDCYTNDDPWQYFRWLGKDAYVVSYLEEIVAEMDKIICVLHARKG